MKELPTVEFNLEAPKEFNLVTFIKKRCQILKIENEITTEPIYRSFFEKLFSLTKERETIFIKLKGSENIPILCDDIQNYMDGIKSQIK